MSTAQTTETVATPEATIEAGVPVFERTDALRRFLDSLPETVARVIVADNGERASRDGVYAQPWPFDLKVLDLPHDCGIGECRNAIASTARGEYLFVADCDMRVVREGDLRVLAGVLEREPHLGGIAGWLREGDVIRSGASDLHDIRIGPFRVSMKDIASTPRILESGDIPYAEFDMIPQAGLFRVAAFETATWDPRFRFAEHEEFFISQQAAGDWRFASTPAVIIHHDRDIDSEYRAYKQRADTHNYTALAAKHGVDWTTVGERPDWTTTYPTALADRLFDLYRRATPPQVWVPTRAALRALGVVG